MSLVTTSTIPTPMKSTPSLAAQQTPRPSPGTFRHPRISEIVARQHATSLTSAHVTAVWMNLLALLVWFIAGDSAQNWYVKCCRLAFLYKALTSQHQPQLAFEMRIPFRFLVVLFDHSQSLRGTSLCQLDPSPPSSVTVHFTAG